MDGQIRTVEFLFRIQTYADRYFQRAVNQEAARQCNRNAEAGAYQLRHEGNAANTAERLQAKNARRQTTPCTA
ncbi:hypothetical protein D3C81_2228160 [compost metagenome]